MQRKWILPVLALVMVIALAGCARTITPTPTPVRTPSASPMTSPIVTTPGALSTPEASPMTSPETSPETTPGTTGVADAAEVARNIVAEVDKLSEIKGAAAAVSGNTAIVAVEFDEQYMGELTTRIKDMVTDKAKSADAQITRVVVTADPDLLTRVQKIFEEILAGNGTGVASEFEEIVNRAAPT